ncbi:MAG: flagellar export chaperone FliS [Planctomycetes bacterium]|nr:flagellar export chaperone FliS [Planctomycetota bacterium]
MAVDSNKTYLRDAVMTASPEQLQLMLYDGAIRFARQGRDALEAKDFETAFERLSRAQKIVLEMQQGLNFDVDRELCERMSGLYMFAYRKLVDACCQHAVGDVDDALRVLEYERQTWVMLVDKLLKLDASQVVDLSTQVPAGSTGGALSVEG